MALHLLGHAQGTLYGHSHCCQASELCRGLPGACLAMSRAHHCPHHRALGKIGTGVTSLTGPFPTFPCERGCPPCSCWWGLSWQGTAGAGAAVRAQGVPRMRGRRGEERALGKEFSASPHVCMSWYCQPGHVLQQAEQWPPEPGMGHSLHPAHGGIYWAEIPALASLSPSKCCFASLHAGAQCFHRCHPAVTSPREQGWSWCLGCACGHTAHVGWGCILHMGLHSPEMSQHHNALTTALSFHHCSMPPSWLGPGLHV